MKKNYSIMSLMLGILVSVALFSSCSKDDDSSSNPLVGTWRAEVEEKGVIEYLEMTFNSNFTLSYIEYNKDDSSVIHSSETGTYEIIDSNTFKAIRSDGKVATRKFKITDGNKLEFTDRDHGIIYYNIK